MPRGITVCITIVVLLARAEISGAQEPDSLSIPALKLLDLEELMNIDIMIVSKTARRLFDAPAAVHVIRSDDIERSGAASLPEALRLAPNLRVAQLNSYAWVIASRGFSGLFSNKLLVMIDGRSVYTPLFAGVFWDAQQVLLNNIDRIEVISGPGGTLWGANAVNGVINIISKNSAETQGWYVSALAGSFLRDGVSIRYGFSPAPEVSLRFHVQRFDRGHTFRSDGSVHTDRWASMDGGFRMDWTPSPQNSVTVLGGTHFGLEHTDPGNSTLDGQHLLGRWTRTYSDESRLRIQAYVDRTWRRDMPSTISDQMNTYDIEIQHGFSLAGGHRILWGGGFRLMQDETPASGTFVGFLPVYRVMKLFNGFVQDEILLIPDRLNLTLGTKLEHNEYSGFEFQPGFRISWTPTDDQTVWGAASRAVRSPSRIDVDYRIPKYDAPPTVPQVAGGPNFGSEKLLAFEIGYRLQPIEEVSVSVSGYFHRYDDVYGVEALPGTVVYQIQNIVEGESRGVELAMGAQPVPWWQVSLGYAYFEKNLRNKPGHVSNMAPLGNDPDHQVFIHSKANVLASLQFDVTGRYVERLPSPPIPAYHTIDARIAWLGEDWQFAVVGQNLSGKRHAEFGTFRIPRGVYTKLSLTL